MIKYLLMAILIAATSLFSYLYFYLGAGRPVEIRVENYPELQLLYVEHLGPYHTINEKLVKLETAAKAAGIACAKTFGKFLDNPETTDSDRLRAQVGCVLEAPIDEAVAIQLSAKISSEPSKKYVYAKFDGSPAISPFVVYPKIKRIASEQRLALKSWSLEIYSMDRLGALTTEYLVPAQ